jgi:rRNA maturation endonuclease Nob1
MEIRLNFRPPRCLCKNCGTITERIPREKSFCERCGKKTVLITEMQIFCPKDKGHTDNYQNDIVENGSIHTYCRVCGAKLKRAFKKI